MQIMKKQILWISETQKEKKGVYYKIIVCNKLEYLFQVDKFLEKHNPLNVTREEQKI